MRHGTTSRRQRNRGNGGRRNNQNRSQVFDSNGPDVRIRGTAHQVAEKYEALAKDATSSGDRILAESYLQHAEHYLRIISNWDESLREGRSGRAVSDERKPQTTNKSTGKDDDLSLPASILGDVPNADKKEVSGTRTPEMSTT